MQINDPQFPDRPEHDDFWRLAAAVTANDKAIDEGRDLEDYVNQAIDYDCLRYIARQRALRVTSPLNITDERLFGALIALWMDAFMACRTYLDGQTPVRADPDGSIRREAVQ